MFDVCIIGHVTVDLNTIAGVAHRPSPGGGAYYAALAYRRLGLATAVVTRVAAGDADRLLAEIRSAGAEVLNLPTERSTVFHNVYRAAGSEARTQTIDAIADPFVATDAAAVPARLYNLAPLTRADIPVALIEAAAATGGLVALGVQGFLRAARPGTVSLGRWTARARGLKRVAILQGDVDEVCRLAGTRDTDAAMARLAALGPDEVIATDAAHGSRVLARGRHHRIPAFAPARLKDSTGCGDTYLAGYTAHRLTSDDVGASGLFGAATASLKLEIAGPFRGTLADVHRRLRA